jgi:seryl-tRNA synthetase
MFDIKWIRDNPNDFDNGLKLRGLDPLAEVVINLDAEKRKLLTAVQELQSKRNEASKNIGRYKKEGNEQAFNDAKAEMGAVREQIQQLEEQEKAVADQLEQMLVGLPNLPFDDVPFGKDENDNVLVRTWGKPGKFDFKPKQHFDLGEDLGLMSFERAAKMSGARFVNLSGPLARLERALASFMLDIHTQEFQYEEQTVPFLVRDNAVYGVGQLPKFSEDLFKTTNGYWLISTAEVPLTNLAANEIIDEDKLPLRYTGYTPCFRSEAGAAGQDTRGMIRQHQFTKVELVSITKPDKSAAEHERMLSAAETVLQKLELPYRVMLLCSQDMGGAARKTYDIEVWLPGQDCYREISSCSNCGEYQARRMKSRYRAHDSKKIEHVHTLNGSGLAIGRTIVALLENYQQQDGSIVIPEALRPYMGGMEVITANV